MPIYEYQCENGHTFEVLQRMNAPPLEKCQLCSGKAWRKISLSTHSKGAGMYFFHRKYGDKDILHDPQFTDRERGEIISGD